MANKYTSEYKVQAVKLAMEVGTPKADAELGISENTIYGRGNSIWGLGAGRRRPL
jgi:hypothetical protein